VKGKRIAQLKLNLEIDDTPEQSHGEFEEPFLLEYPGEAGPSLWAEFDGVPSLPI
jgi:hypothetical protein